MGFIKFLAAIAVIASLGWLFKDPGFESALSLIGSISALVSAVVVERRRRRRSQHQVVSGLSTGVQAGGDVHIGSIGNGKHVK